MPAAEGAGDYGREHTIGGIAAASGFIGCNPGVGPLGGNIHASDSDTKKANLGVTKLGVSSPKLSDVEILKSAHVSAK